VDRYASQFKLCIGIDANLGDRNRTEGNIHYVKGDLECIPLKNECVDVFLTNFVVEHLNRPEDFFREVNRVMKTNGILIIWTPNVNSVSGLVMRLLPISLIKNLKKNFMGAESHPTYYLSNSPTKLDLMLNEVGLEKVKLQMIDGVFYFSELRIVRWLHSTLIKITDREGFDRFKDIIFAIYLKSTKP
jgi:SAM-dependent methyltransferase